MANLHPIFHAFDNNIAIAPSKRASLIRSRNALREVIRADFKSRGIEVSFWIQGSFKKNTLIRKKSGICDIDDGIYLDSWIMELPKPNIIQEWVKDALEGHTKKSVEHRKKCVRITYARDYNIDLPVFAKSNGDYIIATKDGWKYDDPKKFIDWFKSKRRTEDKDGQLTRLVRYLKTWGDYKGHQMPSGLMMTIFAAQHYSYNKGRSDLALLALLQAMQRSLNLNWQCFMPTSNTGSPEDLFEPYPLGSPFERNFKKIVERF